jgi:5-dehydro-2-deoxygluconokinase
MSETKNDTMSENILDRPLDVICLGRVAVDLYGQQVGGPLEDMQSFAKSLGGSSGNVAFGTARLGLRPSMLSRVGDEQLGSFLRSELKRVGCDTSMLVTDPKRLTALVILGRRGDGTFPHIFYRTDPADMAISPDDFDETFIELSWALAITGTHLSQEKPRAACAKALRAARGAGTKTILDIDYRPVLWGLTGHGEGEDRFVASDEVTQSIQPVLGWFDYIVGTEEEIHIAGGSTDTITALRNVRQHSGAVIVLKRGVAGCVIFEGDIPESVEDGLVCHGFPVPVSNTLGAGDAFMSGFLRGLLRGEDLETCGKWANACGALVVNRDACAPSMPSFDELMSFIRRAEEVGDPRTDMEIVHLHRVAERRHHWHQLNVLAFDHRKQFEEWFYGAGADAPNLIRRAKQLIADGAMVGAEQAGLKAPHVILDDRYGAHTLARLTGSGAFLARPIELPGHTPLHFEGGPDVGTTLRRWPRDHVVKVLVRYDAEGDVHARVAQETQLLTLYRACLETDHELMLEVLPADEEQPIEARWTLAAMARLYEIGIKPDWWKLAAPQGQGGWRAVGKLLDNRDPYCRGVLLLGMDAPLDEMVWAIEDAAKESWVKGFAVGRTIFKEAVQDWLQDFDDNACRQAVSGRYMSFIEAWRRAREGK